MSDYESEAREWLASVDVPPSRLDTGQLVQVGRAQVRRRRYLAAGGATAAVLAIAVALPAAVQGWPAGTGRSPAGPGPDRPLAALDCDDITTLELPDHPVRGTPDLSHVRVRAMDPTGRYVLANWVSGEVTGTDDPQLVVLWDTEDGTATYLPTASGNADGQAVNPDGVVVGANWDGGGDPWVYRDGDVEPLPVPEGYPTARADAVSDTGDVYGIAEEDTGFSVVVVWPADHPNQPEVLAAPGTTYFVPAGTAADGVVVATGDAGPYRWDADRVGRPLPLPEGATGGEVAAVRGEWAAGSVALPVPAASIEPVPASGAPSDLASLAPESPDEGDQPVSVPARWNLRTDSVEVLDPGVASRYGADASAVAVNATGDLIVSEPSPFVVRAGRPYTLPVPVEGGYARPEAISDDGKVFAGTVVTEPAGGGDPVSEPTVWRC